MLKDFYEKTTQKIMNSALFEDVKKVLGKFGIKDSSDIVKKVISSATQKVISPIKNKIAVIFSIITTVIFLIPIIITLIAGGKFVIPIIILFVILIITWVIAGIISSKINKKLTDIIFLQLESNFSLPANSVCAENLSETN
ncbi:MAG: hypothetical protein FWB86_02590 [Treponema sp.]|nr:hypothetical protein [Treponema sp.]